MSAKSASAILKEQGNRLFQEKDFSGALAKYTEAIEQDPDNVVLYSNRSACYANLSRFMEAEQDAIQCVNRDPSFLKGYYRLSVAHCEQGHYEEAVKCVQAGLERDPQNEDLQKQLKVVQSRSHARNPVSNSLMSLTQEQQNEFIDIRDKIEDGKRDLMSVRSSTGLLTREKRRNEVCKSEISSEKFQNAPLFLSVGRAFLSADHGEVMHHLNESGRAMERRWDELKSREQFLARRLQGDEKSLNEILSSGLNNAKS